MHKIHFYPVCSPSRTAGFIVWLWKLKPRCEHCSLFQIQQENSIYSRSVAFPIGEFLWVSISLSFVTVCKLPMAELKCIHMCGIFHSSSYFMSCISENHLRFAYMINFPFLVIKKKRLYLQSSLLLVQKSQEKTFGLFIPFSSPLHCNEDNTEMWSNLTNSKTVEI